MTPLFRSANSTSFDRLYEQHAASVYRYARAVLGNHADAEDVTQQTFLNAYRAIAKGTKPRKAENWIFTIAHNEVRRHFRDTRAHRLEVELDTELAEPVVERTEPSVTDVLRALQHLTPNQRSALVMREFEGRSYAEIAEIMDVSQSALETLMFRARRTLAEALEDGLTCAEAELAVSRRIDGRLSRRETRRLKRHIRECGVCQAFDGRQRRQRSLLKGLSVIPVPASLLVFRGESAAAALGGSTAVGVAAAGGGVGIAAKAAAVAATVAVAGGVGYGAGTDRLPVVQGNGSRAPQSAVAPAARGTGATVSRVRVRRPSRGPVAALPGTKSANSRPGTPKPTKSARSAAKEARKAAGQVKPKQQHPAPASPATRVKEPKVGPTPTRQVREQKPKQAEKGPSPVRPAKPTPAAKAPPVAKAQPATEPKVIPAPVVPPGLEKKLLDPPKPEKPTLP